jgi:SAM-dependent methyltransferase
MSGRKHYDHCPVCGATVLRDMFRVKDYTVSGEVFVIAECAGCSLRLTQDAPGPEDIAPYYRSEEYISHSNTARGFINRLYHFVRKFTIRQKRRLVEKSCGKKAGRLLDVGSGTGAFLHEMKQRGWETTGLEPDAGARRAAMGLYGIELMDAVDLHRLAPGQFDAITLWHVLEHVHDLEKYVGHLKSLLHDNGRLFIAVPNYTSKDAADYREYWAAYDVPRHLYHFSPAAMKVLVESKGLHVLAYQPMWYDSFYISLLSSRYKKGKTNWLAALWNGFNSNLAAAADARKCSSIIYVIGK